MMGVEALQDQNQPAKAELATASQRQSRRLVVAWSTGVVPSPCFVFSRPTSFSYLMFFLRTSLQGFLEKNYSRFRLGLTLKAPLGRNKVVRLGLYLGCILDSSLWNQVHQLIKPKFLFLFSFVCSYFLCLILLIMFMFSLNV